MTDDDELDLFPLCMERVRFNGRKDYDSDAKAQLVRLYLEGRLSTA